MVEKINIIRKALLFLQTYSKSRFGSGVIGFLIASLVAWYGFIEDMKQSITNKRIEIRELNRKNDSLLEKIAVIREEEQIKAELKQKEYLYFIQNYYLKVSEDISNNNIRKSKEIKKLENEIENLK